MPGIKMIIGRISLTPGSQNRWINQKRRPDTTPWQLLCKPMGHYLQEHILKAKYLDIDIKNIIETIQKNGPTNLLNDITDWKIEEINRQKTIFYKGKNYIPRPMMQYSKNVHDHKTAGHLCTGMRSLSTIQDQSLPGNMRVVMWMVQCSQDYRQVAMS